MDAKEYLSQAYVLNRRIKAKERQLDVLKEHVPYSGPLFGDVKTDSNQVHSAVESSALRFVSLSEEVKKDIAHLADLMKQIENTIRRVENSEMEVILEMRYLSFMSWDEIISRMGYSARYVFKMHSIALRRIKNFI